MDPDDPAFEAAFRAAIDTRVATLLAETGSRWGTVVSIDTSAGTCVVDLGYDGEKTVTMHMIRPALVGQEVRIEGPTADRYVADVKGGGLVVGGKTPGDLEFTARTPDGITEVLCYGQTITNAQTTYPVLWSMIPAALKSGSSLLVPQMAGRVPVGRDDMSGSDAGNTSIANTIGATGGARTYTLLAANMVPHTHTYQVVNPNNLDTPTGSGSSAAIATSLIGDTTGAASTGSSPASAFSIEQPGTVANWILFLGVPAT